jgi:hypothetical protein
MAQPGMVLAAPVTDRRGRLLIPAETALTERHVEALKMWGIPQIEVDGDSAVETTPTDLPPEVEARVRAQVDARFGSATDESPFMTALKECAVHRALNDASVEGATA